MREAPRGPSRHAMGRAMRGGMKVWMGRRLSPGGSGVSAAALGTLSEGYQGLAVAEHRLFVAMERV
jgi:hypothetical protein